MNKILSAVMTNGFTIMMIGFFLALTGLILYMKFRFSGGWPGLLSFSTAIAGFVIYVSGRIIVTIARRKPPKKDDRQEADD